jgi:hypothetical protein
LNKWCFSAVFQDAIRSNLNARKSAIRRSNPLVPAAHSWCMGTHLRM